MFRFAGVAAAFLCLQLAVFGQSVDVATQAESFRKAVAGHRERAWFPEFLETFLGKNHAKAQPQLSTLLEKIGRGNPEEFRTALRLYRGDKAVLGEVLELARQEAGAWGRGKVLRQETLSKLWSLLYSAPPKAGSVPRLERYEAPEAIREWLVEEQQVNDKIMRFKSSAARGSLAVELDPTQKPLFWLPHVEIPVEEARILEAGELNENTKRHFFVEREGRAYVRYFIHPGSLGSPSIQKILEKYPVRVEYLSAPTSSPRSLAVWSPYSNSGFFLVKASLAATVGGLRRLNPVDKGIRAVTTTRALDQYFAKHLGGRAPPFLREPMVVFPAGTDFGMIVREVPEGFPGRLVPVSSILSKRPDGSEPRLVEMIKKSGRPPLEYVSEKVLQPFMKLYGEVVFKAGMAGEPHQQNVLLEIGRDGEFTGRVVLRDLDSYKMDLEMRLRNGVPMGEFFGYTDPGLPGHLKLAKGRSYYNDSYLEYVREDWGYLLGVGLKRYFPEFDARSTFKEIDRLFAIEVKKHLGVDMKPSRFNVDPNQLMEEHRTRLLAEPVPVRDPRVTQKMLKEEFERLQVNRRVLMVAPKQALEKSPLYILHDGVIEVRGAGKVVAFALLEPPKSVNFYKGVTHKRVEPNPRRLALLYKAAKSEGPAAGQRNQGEKTSRARVVGVEAMGAGHFAGAFLIKEGLKAVESGDAKLAEQAVLQMKEPMFWLSLGAFTASAKGTDRLLQAGAIRSRLPARGLLMLRASIPVAAGMAASSAVAAQRVDPKEIGVATAAYGGVGVGVNRASTEIVKRLVPRLGAPGRFAQAGISLAQLVATLYVGEKADGTAREALNGEDVADAVRHQFGFWAGGYAAERE